MEHICRKVILEHICTWTTTIWNISAFIPCIIVTDRNFNRSYFAAVHGARSATDWCYKRIITGAYSQRLNVLDNSIKLLPGIGAKTIIFVLIEYHPEDACVARLLQTPMTAPRPARPRTRAGTRWRMPGPGWRGVQPRTVRTEMAACPPQMLRAGPGGWLEALVSLHLH